MRATPARRRAASADPRSSLLGLLAALILLSSCQSASGLRYSLKKSTPSQTSHYVVEATLHDRSHILVVYDAKWVVLNVGEAAEDYEASEEGDEPIPSKVGNFSGTILAVRILDGHVDFRAYHAKNGHIVGKERSTEPLAEGTVKELPLGW